jgi:hypothetical protein
MFLASLECSAQLELRNCPRFIPIEVQIVPYSLFPSILSLSLFDLCYNCGATCRGTFILGTVYNFRWPDGFKF